jgi:acyl dehydratase
MTNEPQDTSAEEPDGGNLQVRFRRGLGLGNRPGLLNTHGSREVGPRRWRESFGRYYEEFEIGDVYEHRPGRTITEADNTWFTLLTMNNHPLHFDAEYAAKSEFGRPLVNSCLTLAIVVGMSVSDVSYKAIGNLGWNDIKLPAPVFAGDTLYAESEVLGVRESQSRPTQGIVTVKTRGSNQDGKVVISYERTILVPKRGHGVEDL